VAFAVFTIYNSAPTGRLALRRPSNRDSIPKLVSGYYGAVIDSSGKHGLKVYNEDSYYYLDSTPSVTLDMIDSTYKKYDSYRHSYILVFQLNKVGRFLFLRFTEVRIRRHCALVLNNNLIWAPMIEEPVETGEFAGKYSEKQIDSFQVVFNREIKRAKNTKARSSEK